MQKWEYAIVTVTDTNIFNNLPPERKRTVAINRQDEVSKPLGTDMLASFQQLGADGWELFSMNSKYGRDTSIVISTYWFKRLVQP